jgi:hypothetical protein
MHSLPHGLAFCVCFIVAILILVVASLDSPALSRQATYVAAADAVSDGEEHVGEAGGTGTKKRKAPGKPEKPSKLQESLLRALECSVCMTIMVAPVYQCLNGHSICK